LSTAADRLKSASHSKRTSAIAIPRILFAAPLGAVALIGAAPAPAAPAAAPSAKHDWAATIAAAPAGGVLIGNPDARYKLVEFISYTCSHCAHFAAEAATPLASGFIADGSTSVEIRPYLRTTVDYAISLAVACGTPQQVYGNHAAVLAAQPEWLARLAAASPERQAQWDALGAAGAMAMVIADSGLQPLLAKRGIGAEQLSACLADGTKLQAIADSTNYASRVTGVQGTPSFTLNGLLLYDIYDWAGVHSALVAARSAHI
jgi:protein-disulfide isomerase